MTRATRVVLDMLSRIEHGHVELTTARERYSFGDPDAPLRTQLDVHDAAFFSRVLRGGSVGAGESYMAGEWTCSDLVALVRIVIANRSAFARIGPGTLAGIAADRVVHLLRDNRRAQARRNIRDHYDLSNEFYELFLDDTMTYSSAIFDDAHVSLEQAQRAKYRQLAELVRIGPGLRVLEIGCGWGGFAEYAVKEHDCHVTAITLSEQQATYARRRIADAGLDEHVDVRIVDYRDVRGRFDRVVSIEMLEAVGHRHLGDYFAAIDRVLAPDGLAVIQVITIPEQRYRSYRRRPDFIQRHIFPGGHLPSLTAMTKAMGRRSSLFVESVGNVGMHYAETLRRWRDRFLARVDDVSGLGFDESFVRMWEFYLAYCEAAFRSRYINDLQLVLTRPSNPTLGSMPYRGEAV